MMTVIIGGSGSGKSAYAENYVISLAKDTTKYYLATMQVYDEEGWKKIERHRKLRMGKGFLTIEQPLSIQKALAKMDKGEKAVLLECMSNLTANEMFSEEIFSEESYVSAEVVTDKIIRVIECLKGEVTHLVIVANNVFEDGISYDETTMEYLRAMGNINERICSMADEVIEVVVGIPVVIKSKCIYSEQ